MAIIDSGLGWSCEENYYIYDAGTQVTRSGNHNYKCYKANSGSAICVRFKNIKGGYTGNRSAVLVSTVENYCVGNPNDYLFSTGSYLYNGLTWYLYIQKQPISEETGDQSALNNFPEIDFPTEYTISDITNAANVPLALEAILTAASTTVKPVSEYFKIYRKANGVWVEITPIEI